MKHAIWLWLFLCSVMVAPASAQSNNCVDLSGTWKGTCESDGRKSPADLVITQSACHRVWTVALHGAGEKVSTVNFASGDYSVGHLTTQSGYYANRRSLENVMVFTADWDGDQSSLKTERVFIVKHGGDQGFSQRFAISTNYEIKNSQLIETAEVEADGIKSKSTCTYSKAIAK